MSTVATDVESRLSEAVQGSFWHRGGEIQH